MHERTRTFMARVYEAAETDKDAVIARAIAMPKSTLHRQLNQHAPLPAETVIALSRAYELDILSSLVVTGHITAEERLATSTAGKLDSLPDSALLTQLLHRAATREQDDHNDTGPSNSPSTPLAPVTGLHTDPLPYAALTDDTEHRMDRVQSEEDGA